MPQVIPPQPPIYSQSKKSTWAFEVFPGETMHSQSKSHGNIAYVEFDDQPKDGFIGNRSMIEDFFMQQESLASQGQM